MKYLTYAGIVNANEETKFWIGHNLSNYLQKNPENQDEVEHIIDYFAAINPARLKQMSYAEAKGNADKWLKTQQKKGAEIEEKPEDTKIVLDFKDGFKIVQLIGENAYKREGFLMSHCVGSYFGRNVEIYSLRDKDNLPHCTMEKDQQIKGKGNGNIHPKYISYVIKFLEFVGMTVGENEMKHLGYINVEKIKKHLHNDTKFFNKTYLPENEKLIGTDGKEFLSLDLLDIKPLITEVGETELKINFDLPPFIRASIEFLSKTTKKFFNSGDSSKLASSGHYSQLASSGDSSQLASSGHSSKLASSGHYSQLASSGHYSQLASSGHSSQLASSGDSSQLASSGHSSKLASSGHYSQLASSGHYSQLASSGHYSQLASSGDSSQLASSGHSSKLASSGHSSQLASSGHYSQLASSGHSSKLASSGHYSQLASSGHYSQLASSGHYSQLASSGDSSQLASSGHSSKLEITGDKSVGANIGINGIIKGKIGTWITLAEYNEKYEPVCVKSVQIDGKKIKEDIWYKLKDGKFVEA